jgi:hypothetical protein
VLDKTDLEELGKQIADLPEEELVAMVKQAVADLDRDQLLELQKQIEEKLKQSQQK